MGLFDLFRKKKLPQKEETTTEIDLFSGKGLIDFVKSNLDNPTEENVLKAVQEIAKPDADQEHLTSEGELPWGWLSRNVPLCQPYEDKIIQAAVDLKNFKGMDRIPQLEKIIKLYNKYKNFCYGKNECYIKYFSDSWEHCHNSRCDDFEYITPYVEELNRLKGLDVKAWNLLADNDGISRPDYLRMFDESTKDDVLYLLEVWEKEEKVEKEKKGRSYVLHIRNKGQK